jgi:hypothetical protein
MTYRNLAIVLCLVTGVLVCGKAKGQTGQTSQDVDRSQIFRSEPSIRPGEPISQGSNAFGYAAPSANDADLGVQAILKRQEQYQPFTLSGSLPYYWTSNVALVRSGEVSDVLRTATLIAEFPPLPSLDLMRRVAADQKRSGGPLFNPLVDPTGMGARDVHASTRPQPAPHRAPGDGQRKP